MKKQFVKYIFEKVFPKSPYSVSCKNLFGHNLYVFADQHVGRKIILGMYESQEKNFLLNETRPSDVCLDIGANIGFYSFLFASKAKQVFAIEPILTNVKLMELTAAVNDIKNINIINALAADAEGELEFIQAKESSLSGIKTKDFAVNLLSEYGVSDSETYTVRSVVIDKLDIASLDIVKIDVEGAELRVLKGMSKTIRKTPPKTFNDRSC
ncbi:MAG: FkbM family methyltransferase [Gammaproteobacteria bacterium]|nr:FkbM family methyltransferase [Gammaproteobacteria bacterium]